MLAFAGNSIICRLALRDGSIDPAGFTSIRLLAGAITLLVLLHLRRRGNAMRAHGSWISAFMLFLYAVCFSYAYVSLHAGTGALILFGFVQATMIAGAIFRGERPAIAEWLGWLFAFAGLVWLLAPGSEAPRTTGALLMACAGISWGVYSIRGRAESDALASTTSNFTLSLPLVLVLVVLVQSTADLSRPGILLAVASGALTSGIGYVIWYAALERLSAMQAALVQLSVPAIAAIAGVLLLAEPLTSRLLASSALVLGGIGFALLQKSSRS